MTAFRCLAAEGIAAGDSRTLEETGIFGASDAYPEYLHTPQMIERDFNGRPRTRDTGLWRGLRCEDLEQNERLHCGQ